MPENTIAVAMSGGVDSSTAAALLCRQGYDVIGLTMQLWNQRRLPELESGDSASRRCCMLDDAYDAHYVAERLGIRHHIVNLERHFEDRVVRPFVAEYLAGRTPIPCALCNSHLKFDRLLELAAAHGAARIATGHYARIARDQASGRWLLMRGADAAKDQSYFLFGLTQEQLARSLFPLGGFTKTEVRRLASDLGVPVAGKRESQEICFVPGGDYGAFIDAWFREQGMEPPPLAGEVRSTDGRLLGRHEGVHRYTVGQRKGLGVAAGEPLYVVSTDPATRRVTVGRDHDLFRGACTVRDVNWIAGEPPGAPVRAAVKIRNKHDAAPALVTPLDEGHASVEFDAPQRAVTPGQAAVFYQGDIVLGGGWIE